MLKLARALLWAALGILAADTVLTAVEAVIWPQHLPAWTTRTSAAAWLACVLLALTAGGLYLLGRRRG